MDPAPMNAPCLAIASVRTQRESNKSFGEPYNYHMLLRRTNVDDAIAPRLTPKETNR